MNRYLMVIKGNSRHLFKYEDTVVGRKMLIYKFIGMYSKGSNLNITMLEAAKLCCLIQRQAGKTRSIIRYFKKQPHG